MPIRYEGRYPNSDSSIVSRLWVDDANVEGAVTTNYLDGEIATAVATANLQSVSYVDIQDGKRATLAAVQTADTLYADTTAKNTVIASLNAGGMVTPTQLPTLITDRVALSFTGTTVFSGSQTANDSTARDRKLATVTITDPGYPYIPLPFGYVSAQSGGTPGLYPWSGTQVTGQLTVCPPEGSGDTIYGLGACTDSPVTSSYPILPYAASRATPTNRPAVRGDLTLDLYGSCFQGSGYVFYSTGLSFYVLVLPAK